MLTPHPILGHLPPLLNFLGLPEDEQFHAIEHMAYAGELWSAVRTFNSALVLFNFCRDQVPHHFANEKKILSQQNEWKLIAARDGMWSIYNLGETMKYFRAGCGKLPIFNNLVDHQKLRTAQKKFKSWFPDYGHIRNALGHVPESTKNPQARVKNYYTGSFKSDGMIIPNDNTQVMVKHSLNGNIYQTTSDGRLLSYEISEHTLNKLVTVKDEFYAGLKCVETETGKVPSWKSRGEN